ncbi:rho guanine nucleotide exchange factor 10 [Plakobranchus ocellatus]|uniref:Rho guanine nucleotide exchange factor 10 n=1 Tax=Plakobranchus ocellatus TaxID=259542 RepID=A0AAV3Z9F4_9GAST|nr:rho guanine nucleotide exchange factor 10 [Plakobranchus ocellatus]
MPGQVHSDSSEYNRLFFRSTESARITESQKQRLAERGYGSLASLASKEPSRIHRDYNNEGDDISLDWGSEFDDEESMDFDEMDKMLQQVDQEADGIQAPDKPLPAKPQKQKGFSPKNFFQGQTPGPAIFYQSSETGCLPVYINPEKHPPPELPPTPEGLTENQKKRRLIIELIISSERSYLESLERIIKDYERALLEFIPGPKSSLRPVFREMREIICHHKMFQIELAEAVKNWDHDEKIGDIFTASFSKTMLVRAYSVYVNNFAQAMEEIRSLQRSRQNFDEFLKKQEKLGADRLSIFGLMVKPVQRFPQFIMVLQDLIKFTPTAHCDRRSLQLALTELENVAFKLNERKRHSEQKFQAKQVTRSFMRQKMSNLLGGSSTGLEGDTGGIGGLLGGGKDGERRLIRCDDVEQVFGDFGNMKSKPRRLILMNDLIMCCKVIEKEQGGFRAEKLDLKWAARLIDLELKDTGLTPDMQKVLKKEPGKIHLMSAQIEKPEDDPFHLYADLREMLHDYNVLEQVVSLLGSLKRSYTSHGLKEELLQEVCQDLENMIHIKDEQLRVVNSCTIQLVNHSRSDKAQYVIQTQTAAIKEDWCTDFVLAKLAREKTNKLAWDIPTSSEDSEFDAVPAHFMKYVVVDRPKNYTKVCISSVR